MRATNDHPYTPEIIEAVFQAWPEINAARESGTMSLRLAPAERPTIEDKLTLDNIGTMMPRASRATNTTYSIDNVAAVVCDIDSAIAAGAISKMQWRRMIAHYFFGFTQEEIAEAEGVSSQAISYGLSRSCAKIAEWLEMPKERIQFPVYKGDSNPTNRRKYQSVPRPM